MRLQRLDLLRYGHFTDRSFELPAEGADFHVIFGPNEAGKSTTLSAIEDLLFGIPTHSPYNFLHDYASMRIGALIENGETSLEAHRRKGTKDTLLGVDGLPMAGGEGSLRPFLVGADRSFFERMFSLDNVRLKEGGREILEANDEIGQMLFSAGAGITGLRDRLIDLSEEADSLWGSRRAARRLSTQAEDKLKEADRELREQTLTANKWQELKRTYDMAEEAYTNVEANHEKSLAEGKRLGRIRRIYRHVRRKAELDDQIDTLGNVVSLPEDARQVLDDAERQEADASARIETLSGQLEQARQDLETLTYDEAIVQRADDLRQLHERRIEIRGEKADLPKRQAELGAAEEELLALARELGWQEDDVGALIARIPARAKVSVVRSLIEQRGELAADLTTKTETLEETEVELTKLNDRLDGMGETADITRLESVIRTVRESGDIAGRLRSAEQLSTETQDSVDRLLSSLHPGIPGEKGVADMQVPARAVVQSHRDQVRELEGRIRETSRSIATADQELGRARKALERMVRDERAVTADELQEVRGRRDTLWDLVKLKHIKGASIPDKERVAFAEELEDLPLAFETSMRATDEIADRRFDNAEATGRLAEMSRTISEQEEQLDLLRTQEEALTEENEKMSAEWRAKWGTAPFEPLDPDAMLEWLENRSELLKAIERRAETTGRLEIQQKEEREARESLLAELAAFDVDCAPLKNDSLRMVLERAADLERKHEADAMGKAQLEESVRNAETDIQQRRRQRDQAEKAWSDWQKQWHGALDDLGLAEDLKPDAVGAQIEVIDQMREWSGRINNLRHDRIDKIVRDVADFEGVVGEIVRQVAIDLEGKPADDAVLEIETRLEAAQSLRGLQESKKEEVRGLEEKVAAMKESRREAMQSVNHLRDTAEADTAAALKEAIEKSDTLRILQADLAETLQTMEQEGDGLAIDALETECAEVDPDRIAAREETITTNLNELRQQLTEVAETRSQAREAFQAIGGDDAAARAAAARQEALAEIREIAGRYVRVRTSAILLQWAIDRYRQEKQAPLLKRAGQLFAKITAGSYLDLRADYDDQDQAHLAGLRPDGEIVRVSGMSGGTEDQLYLALRVASIEDYLERADALPFVADDLFINFDNARSASGFEVLGQLAEKTQVLFFTHHRHLVDIAQHTLGSSVHIVNLADEAP